MRRIVVVFALLLMSVMGCRMSTNPIDAGAQISRSEIMLAHNNERSIRGVTQLRHDPTLQDRAQKWAEFMAKRDSLVHSHLDMQDTNFTYMGENIAMGYVDIYSVVEGWMNSSGHRRNILSKNFTHAGFGYAKTPNGPPYWCAQFGGK